MNARTPLPPAAPALGEPATAAGHFRLAMFGAAAQLGAAMGAETPPCVAEYQREIARRLGRPSASIGDWQAALDLWATAAVAQGALLPLHALRGAGLEALDLALWLAVGLVEEDPRFADVFGGSGRPTVSLLQAAWRQGADGKDGVETVRRSLLGLVSRGLVMVLNPEAPRALWTLAVVPALWDTLRGDTPALPGLRHLPRSELLPLSCFIAPAACMPACAALPQLLAEDQHLLLLRGPAHNGRKTLLGAAAHALGRGLLVAQAEVLASPAAWATFGALATMRGAVPVLDLPLAAGECRVLPPLQLATGALAVVSGWQGGVQTADARPVLSMSLPLPGSAERLQHWQRTAPEQPAAVLQQLAAGARLASGHIGRAARAARGHARMAGRQRLTLDDVRLVSRGLQGARLETLAARLDTQGTLADLALDATTRDELELLLLRCRHREALCGVEGGPPTAGVRALFGGPSGTGKTAAARLLAAELGRDLYRIDLSATVNKFIGETEKNLEAAFSAAEELDVVLLLDEGDALLARRTEVGSANDRYANLETNYLLQRIESYGGILLITSNAADRIDKAFTRRMDVVVAFRAPDETQRYQILRLLLGHAFPDDAYLRDLAWRCALTGGQLRNVVTHAQLLGLADGGAPGTPQLHQALLREYRKGGAHCPLKPPSVAGAAA